MIRYSLVSLSLLLLWSCSGPSDQADAYGNFETPETLVSAQATGPLLHFDLQEGDTLSKGQRVGIVDTSTLHLQREEVQAKMAALESQLPQAAVQLQVLSSQITHAEHELDRTQRLLAAQAATPKQRDDWKAEVTLLKHQYAAQQSSLSIQTRSILAQLKPLEVQIAMLDDNIRRSWIINPVAGVVLTKYAEPGELTAYGKPLYSVGDLSTLNLRAYVTGKQVPGLRIGQHLTVRTDADGGYRSWQGTLTWISSEAEFTPKQIQTKDERANLVYAIKIAVHNDGTLKIGMPGEVVFFPTLSHD